MNPPVLAPLLLALDTSTSTASVALFDGERVLSETTWLAGREHSTRVLSEVDLAFERSGKNVEQLTGLVVARGPGSYTGVRVAISVAKGMAAALGVPAWGVSSLDILAWAACDTPIPVRAILEAGRGRYVAGLYQRGLAAGPPSLFTLEQLTDLFDRETLVVGELSAEARDRLRQVPFVRLAPLAASARRAGFLAELGWRQAQSGQIGDPSTLDAYYAS
jgi:tRNA threonylcarbamoyladenosine biosynthesis protein TsaB